MTIYLCGDSALSFWQTKEAIQILGNPRPEDSSMADATVDATALNEAGHLLGNVHPGQAFHVMISKPSMRRASSPLIQHSLTLDLPPHSFVQVTENVYVACPELVCLQMAPVIPLPRLVFLGMEFAGSYVRDDTSKTGLSKRPRLASVESISAYAAKCLGIAGRKLVERAVQMMQNGTASPRETITYELACLPKLMGGHGLPKPFLNLKDANVADVELASESDHRGDLVWPEQHVILEYNGMYHYETTEQAKRDELRRGILMSRGWSIITITDQMLRNYTMFDALMNRVAGMIGYRMRRVSDEQMAQRMQLRNMLLFDGGQ